MLRVKNMVTEIEKNILTDLQKKGEIVTYTVTADLFYEGQTPVVAYLLLSGNIHLLKGKKIHNTISGGTLIGAKELMNHTPAELSAQIMPKSKVCFLSKSDIREILAEDNEVSKHFDSIINL